MTDEQPKPWAVKLFWTAIEAGGSGDYDAAALAIQRDFAEREEHARAERRNIISHATMGSTTGEGMSVNNICVEITRQRNKLYQAGKNSAEAELVGALRAAICALEDDSGLDEAICCSGHECGCHGSSHRQLLMYNLYAALKSREAGHG